VAGIKDAIKWLQAAGGSGADVDDLITQLQAVNAALATRTGRTAGSNRVPGVGWGRATP
jgi:hypothetical protein